MFHKIDISRPTRIGFKK